MQHRAFATFDLKSVDDEQRIIEGYASTPTPDRVGDVLDPQGAQFKLPMPLLWQHRSDQPIGEVFEAKVTKDGIYIKARIAPDDVAAFIADAWKLIRAKLVRAFSVGWKHIDEPKIVNGIFLWPKWEWLETSAVTIPANADCTISKIKSLSDAELAALGTGSPSRSTAGATASRAATPARKDSRSIVKTIAEQITQFEATLLAKSTRMTELMTVAGDRGETLNEAEGQEYDGLEADVKGLTEHLTRLRKLGESAAQATPIKGKSPDDANRTRGEQEHRTIQVTPPETEKGFGFARAVLCKVASFVALQKGYPTSALDIARRHFPSDERVLKYLDLQQKANVPAATTSDSAWAAPLVPDPTLLSNEFLDYLRPATIVGKFGTTINGVVIPPLRRVPFNVKIGGQTVGGSAGWVGQGKAKPVTKFGYESTTLTWTKIAAITVITEDLARFAPGSEALIRDQLRDVVVARMDMDFIDPDITASSGVRPASITNGLTALTSAGVSAANVLTDLQTLISPFLLSKVGVSNIVLIMPETLALVLSLQLNSLGQRAFPNLEVGGGRLGGFPVITTQYAASESSYGNIVIAVNAKDIALADDGQVTVDASREASIEMDDAPSSNSDTPTESTLVSMFQTNSIALRAERFINWKKLRSSAVVFMDDVNWGSIGSPV